MNAASAQGAPVAARPEGPRIERAALVAGHDGLPELVLQLRYENGSLADVIIDNEAGVRLMDLCGADRIDALVGQSWRQVRDALTGN